MAKVKIYVEKAFKLLGEDGKHTDYPVGNHIVEKETAEHWFVKAHAGDEPPIDPDSQAAADELLAELDSKAKELDEREKAADQLKKDLQAGFDNLRTLKAEVESRHQAAAQREVDLNARAEALDAREVAIAEREKASEAAAKQTGKK